MLPKPRRRAREPLLVRGPSVAALALFAALTVILWGTVAPVEAQRRSESRSVAARVTQDWVLLASREVDRTQGRDRIDLRAAPGSIKAVRLIAKRNEIELTQVLIRYADGRVHDENRTIAMNPNDRTRPMDEGRGEAFADEIELVLRPVRLARGADRTTTIEVWGLQTSTGAKAERPTVVVTPKAADPAPPPTVAPAATRTPVLPPASNAAAVGRSTTEKPSTGILSTGLPVASPAVEAPPTPVDVLEKAASPTIMPVPPAPATNAPDRPVSPAPEVDHSSAAPAGQGGTSHAKVIGSGPGVDPNVAGPPGSAPPLPPARGPNTRAAALPKAPVPSARGPASSNGHVFDGMFLGRKTLQAAGQVDRIAVGVEIGRVAKLSLRTLDGPLRVSQLKIIYSDGLPEIIAYDAEVAANTRSAWIPIPSRHAIREIEIAQRHVDDRRHPPTVEVYGEHAEGYLDPDGDGARLVRYSGWVPLGARTAALRIGFDHLDFQVGPNKGGFRKLRIDAKGRAVTLREVRVVYTSGDDEVVAIDSARQRLAAGASFGPIELRGHARPIKSLILKTRSRFLDSEARGRDAAIVEVWAQH